MITSTEGKGEGVANRDDWSLQQLVRKQFVDEDSTHHYFLGAEFLKDEDMPELTKQIQLNQNQLQRPNSITIHLWYNQIGSMGLKSLAMKNLNQLIKLDLSNNSVTSKGMKYLAKSNWPQLTELSLENNQIDDLGCKALVRCSFPILASLKLCTGSHHNIGVMGYRFLTQASWSHKLNIQINYNKIQGEARRYLKDKFHSLPQSHPYN